MGKRTVAVAAKTPQPGSVKTRLCPPLTPDQAAGLAGAFLRDTLATAAGLPPKLGARTILAYHGDAPPDNLSDISTTPQRGNGLGERLVNIFGDAFAADDGAVCVIGSDTPHLPAAFLVEAFGRLAHADAVFGPSEDGGYYLVALKRSAPALFRDDVIPWSGPDVLRATLDAARADRLTTALLPPWYDIDTIDDLSRLRAGLRRGVADAPETALFLRTIDQARGTP
jgi:hypothetical protein